MKNMTEDIKREIKNKNYDKVKELLYRAIKESPADVSSRVELALLLNSLVTGTDGYVFDDIPGAIEILETGLTFNSVHVPSILLKGFYEFIERRSLKMDILELANISIDENSLHDKYWEQLLLLRAFYYFDIDKEKYLMALNESIKVDSSSSYNYCLLSRCYSDLGQVEKAIKYMEISVQNIKEILEPDSDWDPISFENFVNESYKGIRITRANYEFRIEALSKLKSR
jgi:tetratricopeptide (TPR) repeat protein